MSVGNPQDSLAAGVQAPARLATVRTLGLLDTPADEAFDALTRLAASLLGAPASFVSIVDAERDFYLSQSGLPAWLAAERELRGTTFCHHAIASRQPLAIADTHAEPVWRALPTTESLGVRAYLGVPLWIDNEPIGSLCVIDSQPREWTPQQIATLDALAKAVANEIGLRQALREAQADAERMQALARQNTELLSVIAHDLRTPLQVLSLMAMLIDKSPETTTAAHAQRISRAVDTMKRMVDELLAHHAVEASSLQRRVTLPAAKLLADTLDTMGQVGARAGLSIRLIEGSAAEVRVDYAQMLRSLCNLVGNCIKYCPAGSTVTLSAVQDTEGVRLTVSDDGPGMDDQQQRCAFERGWQGADGMARQDGAGLGLHIVRALVARNDGTVELSSAPGAGAAFTIRLPCAVVH